MDNFCLDLVCTFFNTRMVMRECTAYSPSFSIQPCINKFGGAISSGIVSFIVIISGIKEADTVTDVTKEGLFINENSNACISANLYSSRVYCLSSKI